MLEWSGVLGLGWGLGVCRRVSGVLQCLLLKLEDCRRDAGCFVLANITYVPPLVLPEFSFVYSTSWTEEPSVLTTFTTPPASSRFMFFCSFCLIRHFLTTFWYQSKYQSWWALSGGRSEACNTKAESVHRLTPGWEMTSAAGILWLSLSC